MDYLLTYLMNNFGIGWIALHKRVSIQLDYSAVPWIKHSSYPELFSSIFNCATIND